MKRVCIFLCSLWILLSADAQQYPPEWVSYTLGGYLYDIQSDSNTKNLSETDFKNYLLNIARTNLAKQVQVRVQDAARLEKSSKDGHTTITYSAKTDFSTDEEYLKHIQTLKSRSMYDTGVSISKSDETIILQTCSTHKDYSNYSKKYLLIVAKRIK